MTPLDAAGARRAPAPRSSASGSASGHAAESSDRTGLGVGLASGGSAARDRVLAAPPVLVAEGLQVTFGARRVLDGLRVELRGGEVFGLLGRNGAGKTTLIRTLCGRVRPGAGRISLNGVELGRDRRTDREATRAIGLAPQDLGVYPHLTVRENLEVFGCLSGLPRRAVRPALDRAAERAKLTHRLDDVVGTLSGGYRRRVNIAAAILHDPALLILDEPTVGLDLDAIAATAALVRDLVRDGMAALLVTHDLELAQGLCRRVGFLHAGRLDPVGEPAALIALAFHGRREIAIRLNTEPGPGGRAVLGSLGLTPEGSDRLWTGTTGDETISYADVALGLSDAGLSVREVRVRDPDLESLFKRVLGGSGERRSNAASRPAKPQAAVVRTAGVIPETTKPLSGTHLGETPTRGGIAKMGSGLSAPRPSGMTAAPPSPGEPDAVEGPPIGSGRQGGTERTEPAGNGLAA